MSVIWTVFNEWEEELDEYAIWHRDLHAIFSTEELAKQYILTKEYKNNNHFTYCSEEILEKLPTEHI